MQNDSTTGWAGWAMFAGFMMILIGSFEAIAGLVGIIDDEFYVLGVKYVFKFDATTWGWIHLIWGAVVLLAGLAVFKGSVWARTVGVVVAMFSAIANFAFLPYYPVWSLIIITVCVLVIWALIVHGRELAPAP
jgi:hypothetical protein